jgi:ribonucleoside-triphosphate reductase
MAKAFLDKSGIAYETLLAEESRELVEQYGIKEAPTLVVIEGESFYKYPNPSNIKAFCDNFHTVK